MSGVVWAAIAGVLFGVFQSVNRAALLELDVFASTFIQLLVCSAFMLVALVLEGAGTVRSLPAAAWANFAVAGLIHFLIGWTLLNASQKRLGAARTSPLLSTSPLFGTAIAAATLDEVPGVAELAGIALIVGGVYATQLERVRRVAVRAAVEAGGAAVDAPESAWRASLYGLGAALAISVSPIFIRRGLDDVDDPILGVTIGVVGATLAYGLVVLARRPWGAIAAAPRASLAWKAVAGLLVALATWTRWYALSRTSVATVLALALLSVPTVIVLAPLAAGRHVERITAPIVAGSALVVAGALVLIVRG
jgi:drug/metabolite transporter (DMT)-like permease